MDPRPDYDWKKELSRKPSDRKGFDEELKRRIEEKLDHREKADRRWLLPSLACSGGLALLTAAFLMFDLFPTAGLPKTSSAPPPMESESVMQASGPVTPPIVKTALLLGLRMDHQPKEADRAISPYGYSTYRTLLIAPVDGELQVASEGSGILMPYGMKFWKLEALNHETESDSFHYISAHPADKPAEKAAPADAPTEQLFHREKLLFAGNQYLSFLENDKIKGSAVSESSRVWVRKLPQLRLDRLDGIVPNKADTKHVALQEVFGFSANSNLSNLAPKPDRASDLTGENWAIIRKAGRWTAQAAETVRSSEERQESFKLSEYPDPLPIEVVAHDKLCCTWKDILSLEPNLTDAVSSPLDDMLGIFADGKLKFYSPVQTAGSSPLLTVSLKPGEQLVMAQWATGGYVSEWIEKTRKYLK